MSEAETMERKFDVTGQAHLSLANISGSVDIQPGDDGVIVVSARKDASHGDAENTRIEMAQDANGAVMVKTDFGHSFWQWNGQPCDVHYTVRVPRASSVQLKCVSSNGAVKGLSGSFDLNAVSGDLTLADLSGDIKAGVVSGSLKAEKLQGTAHVDTVSGKVTLGASNFQSMHLSTVSGGIMLESPLGEGPYKFRSVSGDVKLLVPADTKCTVESTSMSGRLMANLPVTYNKKNGPRWHMELQGGGTEVALDSISGNLQIAGTDVSAPMTVAKDIGMPTTPPMPPTPAAESPVAASEQTRKDILERVEKGELSVTDAVELLRG
jgi:hypothetical protein